MHRTKRHTGRHLLRAVTLYVFLLTPLSISAATWSAPALLANAHAATNSFWCNTLSFVTVPLGFCSQPSPTDVAVTPPEPTPPPTETAEPSAPPAVPPPATAPTPPNPPDTTQPPPAAVSPRPAPTSVTNEYITNEYVTNPTTIIREVTQETIRTERTNDIDTSRFVTRDLFYNQVDTLFDSSSDSVDDLSDTLDEAVATKLLTVSGNGTLSGTLSVGGPISTDAYLTALTPTATSTIAGALSVGTTTAHDTFTVGGPVYLANTSPVQTTSRLYNQNGSLYWAGNVVAGAAVGSWDASGGDIYRLTGNVGIGTSSPTARLTVAGGDTRLATTTIDGALTVNGNTSITNGGQLNVGDKIVAPGEIMLGTTTPAGKLTLQSTNAAQTGFALYGASGQFNPLLDIFSNAGSSLLRVDNSGNLGLGTSSPVARLSVVGSTVLDGSLNLGGALAFNNESFTDLTGVGLTNTAGALTVATTTLGLGNGTFLGLADTPGSYTTDQIFYQSGSAVTSSADFTFDGSKLSLGGTGLSLTGSTANLALGSNWLSGDGDDEGVFVDGSGNVGIGLSSPTARLQTAGGDVQFNDSSNNAGLYFDQSTGRLGLGTTSPSEKLTIRDGGILVKDAAPTITLRGAQSQNQTLGEIFFINDTAGIATEGARIRAITGSSNSLATNLAFFTNSTSGSGAERMRIDSTGNVGIGTTAPGSRLSALIGSGDATTRPFQIGKGTQGNYVTVLNNGNVGIGTTNPSSKLSIYDTNTGGASLTIQSDGNSQEFIDIINQNGNSVFKLNQTGAAEPFFLMTDNSGSGVFTVEGDTGNVGVGTSNPNATFDILESTPGAQAFRLSNDIGPNPIIWMERDSTFGNYGNLRFGSATAGGTSVKISGSPDVDSYINAGNVGIGTTDPQQKLSVGGNVLANNYFAQAGSMRIGYQSTYSYIDMFGTSGNAMTFGTNASERMRVTSQGNVGIGTTGPREQLEVKGSNILLSSVQNADMGLHAWADVSDILQFALTRQQSPDPGTTALTSRAGIGFEVGETTTGTNYKMFIDTTGNVGIGTTSPSSKLSVSGDVTFAGLTGATGAGSLCLNSNNEVVFNSGSDACLPSLRETKHDIETLDISALAMVSALESVSFTYNMGDGRTRYGFIAEDVADIDALLATYDAEGNISGIDDRSMIAVVVQGMQEMWSKVQEYFDRTEELESEVETLESELETLKTRLDALETDGSGAATVENEATSDNSTDEAGEGEATEGEEEEQSAESEDSAEAGAEEEGEADTAAAEDSDQASSEETAEESGSDDEEDAAGTAESETSDETTTEEGSESGEASASESSSEIVEEAGNEEEDAATEDAGEVTAEDDTATNPDTTNESSSDTTANEAETTTEAPAADPS